MTVAAARWPWSLLTVAWLAVATLAACVAEPSGHLDRCDIRVEECQRDVFLAVQELRHQTWDPWTRPPRIRLISEEQYRSEVEVSGWAGSYDRWSPALQQIGLLPPEISFSSAVQDWYRTSVGALYSKWVVTIIDRATPLDSENAMVTLAHEYVHALQDRESGIFLYGAAQKNLELDWIARATIEGEATLFAELIRRRLRRESLFDPVLEHAFDDSLAGLRAALPTQADRTTEARFSFPYPLGARMFARAWIAGGTVGPAKLWASPPPSTLSFMDPEGGMTRTDLQHSSCLPPPAPTGWSLRAEDTMGALQFYAFLLETHSEERAWQAARLWRGDRIWLYADDASKTTASVWRIRAPGFDLSPLIGPGPLQRRWKALMEGDDLVIWSASTPEAQTIFSERVSCRR
jgi:hypothetical protein